MTLFKLLLVGILSFALAGGSALPKNISSVFTDTSGNSSSSVPTTVAKGDISRNWSGYASENGTFTGVSGNWIVPKVNSTLTFGADATWVGIGGVNTDDLIQAGTQTTVDRNGNVMYEAFVEMLPDASVPINLSVNAGDTIHAQVLQQASGIWNITLQNQTTGNKTSLVVKYNSSLSSAEWIEEAPSGTQNILPLDDFGSVIFHNGQAVKNGKKVTIAKSNATPLTMGNPIGGVLATATTLGSDGASFSVNRIVQSSQDYRGYYMRRIRLHLFEQD